MTAPTPEQQERADAWIRYMRHRLTNPDLYRDQPSTHPDDETHTSPEGA